MDAPHVPPDLEALARDFASLSARLAGIARFDPEATEATRRELASIRAQLERLKTERATQ